VIVVDKEKLLAPRADTATGLPEDDVDVDGVGTVRVRGLSRDEVFDVQSVKGGIGASERRILHLGMIDPPMSEGEAGQWQKVSPGGEIDPVVDRIRELSGLDEDADRAAMRQFRDRPGDGVRALPGAETVDDGGPAARDDGRA
jgi:hypothetical protein